MYGWLTFLSYYFCCILFQVKCDNKTRGLLLNFMNGQRIKAGFKPLVPKNDDDFFAYDKMLTNDDETYRKEILDLLYHSDWTNDAGRYAGRYLIFTVFVRNK